MRCSVPARLLAPTLCLVGMLALLPACSGDDTPSSTTTATANPVSDDTLDPADPLAYVTFELPATPQCVALGRRFAIEIDAEPADGKRWRVAAPAPAPAASSIVVLGGTDFVSAAGSDDEQQRLTFAAAALGEVDVTLQYVGADGSPLADVPEQTWPIVVTPDGSCPPPPEPGTTIADGSGSD